MVLREIVWPIETFNSVFAYSNFETTTVPKKKQPCQTLELPISLNKCWNCLKLCQCSLLSKLKRSWNWDYVTLYYPLTGNLCTYDSHRRRGSAREKILMTRSGRQGKSLAETFNTPFSLTEGIALLLCFFWLLSQKVEGYRKKRERTFGQGFDLRSGISPCLLVPWSHLKFIMLF